ncbi:MAG: hypothetical protein B7Z04_12785 [Rhodobacterales bacterium 32-66-9]|nr:MAG: hypothetical protein B7Z04_12785 [Rhodobacterales bacterium 32-66-9]
MRLWLFLRLWSLVWHLGLPVMLVYLWQRGRKDPLYAQAAGERFGRYGQGLPGAVWIHAVSLGEMRSAVPLIRALLDRGERVVTTHFTPAGRREAARVFAGDIATGRMAVVWVPFETSWAYAGFFKSFRPKLGLVMEIEIWPRMVFASRRAGVPLYMCNAQYPSDSMARDARLGLRPAIMRGFAGAFVKSDLQAERFASVGVRNISVTGELRFDQPIPAAQLAAAAALRPGLGPRRVIAFASVTEPEEAMFLAAAQEILSVRTPPVVIFVPRAPERFAALAPQHPAGSRFPAGEPVADGRAAGGFAGRDVFLPRPCRPRCGGRRLSGEGVAQHHRTSGPQAASACRPSHPDHRISGGRGDRGGGLPADPRRPAGAGRADLARSRARGHRPLHRGPFRCDSADPGRPRAAAQALTRPSRSCSDNRNSTSRRS